MSSWLMRQQKNAKGPLQREANSTSSIPVQTVPERLVRLIENLLSITTCRHMAQQCCTWSAQVLQVKAITMEAQDVYRGVNVQDGRFMGSEDLGADGLSAIQLHLLHQQGSQSSHALQLPSQVILPGCRHQHSLYGTLVPECVCFSSNSCHLFYCMMQPGAVGCRGHSAPAYHCSTCPCS